jgi:hypothetical protein
VDGGIGAVCQRRPLKGRRSKSGVCRSVAEAARTAVQSAGDGGRGNSGWRPPRCSRAALRHGPTPAAVQSDGADATWHSTVGRARWGFGCWRDVRERGNSRGTRGTGISVELGPCVWTRRHCYHWNGQQFDQYERYFVAHTTTTAIAPVRPDAYCYGHRWWALDEMVRSTDDFAPRRLRELIPTLMRGEYPAAPFDCGV